jgi:hypothetical protein
MYGGLRLMKYLRIFSTLDDLLVCLLSEFGDKIGASLHALAKKRDSVENLLNEHLNVLKNTNHFTPG